MKFLLSGGTGLIGSTFIKSLNADAEVHILSRDPQRYQSLFPENVKFHKWDGESIGKWRDIIDDQTIIINLAGASIGSKRWTKSRKHVLRSSRIESTRTLVQAISQSKVKVKKFLQISAVGYYGSKIIPEIYNETSQAGDDFLAQLCVDWEAEVKPLLESSISCKILRMGIVFSKDDGVLKRLSTPIKYFIGGYLGTGDQWISWVHIQDVIKAMKFLITEETKETIFNITSPQCVTNYLLTKKIGRVLRKPTFLQIPGFVLKLALGEMSDIVLKGQRVYPANLMQENFKFDHIDLDRTLKDLLPTNSVLSNT